MPNKLTDAEIKKALEICSSEHLGCEDGCPLKGMNCRFEMPKYALDLINRQTIRLKKVEHQLDDILKMGEIINAENVSLKEKNSNLTSDLTSAKAEVEKLKEEKSKFENKIEEIYPLVMQLPNVMQQAKAEAYKEFAEKVKSEARYFAANVPDVCEIIDNLLNELVGDDNA